MLRFYFDTNVYDSIAKGRVSENDLDALQSALTGGKAASNFSTVAFEELIGEWEKDRESALRKVKIAHDLISFENSLNPPDVLLRDAIEAYAFGRAEPSPIASDKQQRLISDGLGRLMRYDASIYPSISAILQKADHDRNAFITNLREDIREAQDFSDPWGNPRTNIYTNSSGTNWARSAMLRARALGSSRFSRCQVLYLLDGCLSGCRYDRPADAAAHAGR